MPAEMSRHESPIGIVAAAYAVADDERDGLALVEILGSGSERPLGHERGKERNSDGGSGADHGGKGRVHRRSLGFPRLRISGEQLREFRAEALAQIAADVDGNREG